MVETMGQYKGWKNVFVHLSFPVDDTKRILAEEQIETPLKQEGYIAIRNGKYARRSKWNGWENQG